jgi:hypothetical protein
MQFLLFAEFRGFEIAGYDGIDFHDFSVEASAPGQGQQVLNNGDRAMRGFPHFNNVVARRVVVRQIVEDKIRIPNNRPFNDPSLPGIGEPGCLFRHSCFFIYELASGVPRMKSGRIVAVHLGEMWRHKCDGRFLVVVAFHAQFIVLSPGIPGHASTLEVITGSTGEWRKVYDEAIVRF